MGISAELAPVGWVMAEAQPCTGPWTDVDARPQRAPARLVPAAALFYLCGLLCEFLLHACCGLGAALGVWHEEGAEQEVSDFSGVRRQAAAVPVQCHYCSLHMPGISSCLQIEDKP